ncbi:hypothetical protein PoB_007139900 [Plakobranchus ocellatus]|uniref:Uncharacterized protein n=1 Tax=Plakobranchus ocellatus TaxID=259542 RepID=A0AAV4DLH0_9GAST|nr:hypothetical protein PoB_007139900 [Plakobranchus ocellatus]
MNLCLVTLLVLPVVLGAPAPADEFFDVLGSGLREWRLVFRGTAYINKSVYTAYKDGTNIPAIVQDACKKIDWTQPCNTHYRNTDALKNWNNILEVLYGVVDGGKIVKTVTFKGANTDYMNWFSESHFLNSSWPDLAPQHPHIYGIKGDHGLERRFFISHNYNGCPNDAGWVVAVDRLQVPCDWEKDEAFPIFKYAAGDKFENWNTGNFKDADAIVVFVKYSSGSSIIG